MRKIIITLIAISIWTISLHAFDLSGSLHVDTYGGSPAVGFSFFAEENLRKHPFLAPIFPFSFLKILRGFH